MSDFPRSLLAVFCFLTVPKYAEHLTADNVVHALQMFVSALGFVVFVLNELHRFIERVLAYLAGRRERRKARRKPLKASANWVPA